jgi:hypothetical protein
VPAWVASAEDTIITKLEWAKHSGGSERQLRDVVGIIEVLGPQMDREYISRWVNELGIESLWADAETKASESPRLPAGRSGSQD